MLDKKLKLNNMNYTISTETIGDYKLELVPDDNPLNPREDDNLCKILSFHKNYYGDKHNYKTYDYSNAEELENAIANGEDACVVVPLYFYEHGGIVVKTSPFNIRFDSGAFGFAVVSKQAIRKTYNIKRITKKYLELARGIIEIEVEMYSQYINGDIYGFKVIDNDGCVLEDGYGYYNSEDCLIDGRNFINRLIETNSYNATLEQDNIRYESNK